MSRIPSSLSLPVVWSEITKNGNNVNYDSLSSEMARYDSLNLEMARYDSLNSEMTTEIAQKWHNYAS